MVQNVLSNRAKRDVALSGRAGMGDVPYLYALRAAQQGTGQADLGGTPGLASGTGGATPLDSGAGGAFGGGGGAVGGQADVGLPGASLFDPDLEREYARLLRSYEGGNAPDRGEIASRGQYNFDPADPYGVNFGQGLATTTQVASLLGVPYAGMANTFVNLMLKDAQARSDAFFDSLIEGTAPIDPTSGVTIGRSGAPISGTPAGIGSIRGGDPNFGAELATGDFSDFENAPGFSIERRDDRGRGGDAGSGGGGGGGSGPGSAGGAPGGAQGQGQ